MDLYRATHTPTDVLLNSCNLVAGSHDAAIGVGNTTEKGGNPMSLDFAHVAAFKHMLNSFCGDAQFLTSPTSSKSQLCCFSKIKRRTPRRTSTEKGANTPQGAMPAEPWPGLLAPLAVEAGAAGHDEGAGHLPPQRQPLNVHLQRPTPRNPTPLDRWTPEPYLFPPPPPHPKNNNNLRMLMTS